MSHTLEANDDAKLLSMLEVYKMGIMNKSIGNSDRLLLAELYMKQNILYADKLRSDADPLGILKNPTTGPMSYKDAMKCFTAGYFIYSMLSADAFVEI